uniref:Uncharacterized protein n=1 Tax=Chloropicon laureae TaxID=464258 RepID=A0A7S2Z261_9CHLO|mmetsp:Transcript_182/g.366  ORF Transcript_182/g.366 Transcript_182/m.366 type:complete len:306 (+) Transcript_182:322-1239(+)|eukprot:CAMPEP_0197493228 /NCGR_PEP_ID=MMETSP1311-20131121/20298_1 /TAXON_ID=464262 /ORGANISM="Genus nov. species nov., Strain RCC856" /LENGTH=305 /DNA_ID=CAMNT_0043038433 /DNA_START=255 /DNA_END=1172 /DNA_ORIENTATION=+
MKGVAKFVTLAVAALAAASGSAKAMDMTVQDEHFEALASQLANAQAVNIDLEPLLEVLKDEIHNFVESSSDEESTHKLVQSVLEDMMASEDDKVLDHEEKFGSFEAFTGLLDVVGVPHGDPMDDMGEKRSLARLGGRLRNVIAGGFGGGNVMIPPGTFIGGSPFIGLNDNPSLSPFRGTDEGLRALPAQLQGHFDEFYREFCIQAGINSDAGQYNFPGFDLGSIEIEVSNGGCVVDKASHQLVCSPGSISYTKSPASLNGFSKNGVDYQGSYCPPISFPKGKETKYSASVGGFESTVFNKQDSFN